MGQPKMGGSLWRDLTECGPLEKGMANHFSILALRTPWTVWKGKMIRYWKRNSFLYLIYTYITYNLYLLLISYILYILITYIYYCRQESLRRNEVALMVNKRVQNALLGCNLKNDRMISVRFQGKLFNITVIEVYAPTSNAEEAGVEWFYEGLQTF